MLRSSRAAETVECARLEEVISAIPLSLEEYYTKGEG